VAVTAVRGYIHANHGEYIDIAAPGVNIWTALPNALEGYQSGTSFAAPHVTAILATVRGRVREKSKEGYLKILSVRDLGPPGRDAIYSRSLVLAPANCPHNQRPGEWITSVVESSSTASPGLEMLLASALRPVALDQSEFVCGLEDIAIHIHTNCAIDRILMAVASG